MVLLLKGYEKLRYKIYVIFDLLIKIIMQQKLYTLLVALSVGFVTPNFAQHGNYHISNGFGVMGGITQYDIITDNFITTKGDGFIGGMSATVDIPHRWYNVSFGMQLSENHFDISGRSSSLGPSGQNIEYKLFAAQVALLMHVKVIENHFLIDLGPMIQYNGKMELDDKNQENYFIDNYTNLMASDITNISQFHFNGAVGASIGVRQFKIKAQYIYGFTNILQKLNKKDLDTSGMEDDFKGNQSMLALTAIFTF